MSRTWYTADLHLGHRLVTRLRGFGEDTDAHDAQLAANWDGAVGESDTVWVLGDLCLSQLTRALTWIKDRPGTKHLVAGNHDECHPMHRRAHREQAKYLTAFASVQASGRQRIDGQEVLLSHFPYVADHGFESRFPQWRLPDLGVPLLHGHTHSGEQVTSDREFHIGLDAWHLTPVSQESIIQLIHLTQEQSSAS